MLNAAGIAHEAILARIDERALEAGLGDVDAAGVALALARAKALAVSGDVPGRLVLGSDSLVVCAGRRFDKPASRGEAAAHLAAFSGQVMELTSAAALARDGAVLWCHAETARLHVRKLAGAFIEAYLEAEWPDVGACVGVFRIEGLGVHLFERIEGDYHTVLGMPLLAVLGVLREQGVSVP